MAVYPTRRRRKAPGKTQASNLAPAIGCSQYRHQARDSDPEHGMQGIQSEGGGRAAAATEMSAVVAEQASMYVISTKVFKDVPLLQQDFACGFSCCKTLLVPYFSIVFSVPVFLPVVQRPLTKTLFSLHQPDLFFCLKWKIWARPDLCASVPALLKPPSGTLSSLRILLALPIL